MAIDSIGGAIDAYSAGGCWNSFFHKTSTPTPGAGYWGDMSMGAGIPVYQAYVGGQYEATPVIGQKNQGINIGPAMVGDQKRYLAQLSVMTPVITNGPPMTLQLCDWLMFYPLIDGDSLDQQDMTNEFSLPRYTDGVGVRAFLVVTTPMTANGTTTINYTDTDDVDQSITFAVLSSATVGSIANCSSTAISNNARSPFIPIKGKGIKKINSVTNLASMGGFLSLVLVRPITTVMIREGAVQTERCLISNFLTLPRIYDGAYLNWLALTSGTASPGTLRGQLDFVYG